jgi:hypothetical protein
MHGMMIEMIDVSEFILPEENQEIGSVELCSE